jgi:hypothetical protein
LFISKVLKNAEQVIVINFKFCSLVDEKVCDVIGQHANSLTLRELYLDGCEKINDAALIKLAKPRGHDSLRRKQTCTEMQLRDLTGCVD